MKFRVIDLLTGERADMEKIALREEWARGLRYRDMDGFALGDDGTLLLCDEDGQYRCCPEGRFLFLVEWEELPDATPRES